MPAAAQVKGGKYHFEKRISIPGNGGWDYLAVDSVHHRLFVSHGDEVDVIDLNTETLKGKIDGLHGVHGVAFDYAAGTGFISNGRSNAVTVFDLSTLSRKGDVHVTGKDPDCILYDDYSGQVFTFNGDSRNATAINARTLKVTATIPLGGRPEFAVSDGKGKIYNNLEDKNEIAVLDTRSDKLVRKYPLAPCGGPSALAMDKRNQRLFTACRENKGLSVLNGSTGKLITTLPIGGGVDGACFDPSTRRIFASCGDGTLTVIHEDSPDRYSVIQRIDTQKGARTMALDPATHNIYLSDGKRDPAQRRRILPGSFEVLVYRMR